MSLSEFLENIKIGVPMLVGLLALVAGICGATFVLNYPVLFLSNWLRKKPSKWYTKITIVIIATLMCFFGVINLIFAKVGFPLLNVNTSYEAGFMFFMYLLCVLPITIIMFIKNIKTSVS